MSWAEMTAHTLMADPPVTGPGPGDGSVFIQFVHPVPVVTRAAFTPVPLICAPRTGLGLALENPA